MKRKLLLFLVLFSLASVTFAKMCTITWVVNGETVATTTTANNGAITIYQGAIPPVPDHTFVGWTTQVINGTTATQPTLLTNGLKVQNDATYYAVFKSNEDAVIGVNYQRETSPYLVSGEKYIYACDLENGSGYVMPVNNLASLANTVALEGKSVVIDGSGAISGNYIDCEMIFDGYTIHPALRDPLALYYSNISNEFTGFTLASKSSNTAEAGIGAKFIPFEASPNGLSVSPQQIYNTVYGDIPSDKLDNFYIMMNNRNEFVLTRNESDANIHAYKRTEITGGVYTETVSNPTITLVAKSNGSYYGTYSNPYGIIIPTVQQTYVRVKEALVNGNTVDLSDIDPREDNKVVTGSATSHQGYYVPAGKGILIQSPVPTVSFMYTVATDNTSEINALNKLVSTNGFTANPNCQYFKLAYGNYDGYYNSNNDLLGFWWGAPDGAPFTMKENLAVLEVPSEIQIKGIVFLDDDEVTAITAVEAKKEANAQTYNLAGQRVNANTKGIVIKNGKKYLNK